MSRRSLAIAEAIATSTLGVAVLVQSPTSSASTETRPFLSLAFLLTVLFLVFGWGKLTDYSGAVAYMKQSGAPLPSVAALVAIVIECFGAIALVLSVWIRLLAVLFSLFTLAAGLMSHRYWTMTGADRFMNMINFYKNFSLMGGFFLLYVTGTGKYSIDARWGLPGAPPRRT